MDNTVERRNTQHRCYLQLWWRGEFTKETELTEIAKKQKSEIKFLPTG